MFGFGVTELVLILVIIMVIFGAGKLPEIGAGLGKGIKNFKTAFVSCLSPMATKWLIKPIITAGLLAM